MFWSKKSRRVNSNWWSIFGLVFECEDKYARKGVVGWSMRRVRGRAVAGGCSDTGAATHTASQLYVSCTFAQGGDASPLYTQYTVYTLHWYVCISTSHDAMHLYSKTLLHIAEQFPLCRTLQNSAVWTAIQLRGRAVAQFWRDNQCKTQTERHTYIATTT